MRLNEHLIWSRAYLRIGVVDMQAAIFVNKHLIVGLFLSQMVRVQPQSPLEI